jgi:hypothetical protein
MPVVTTAEYVVMDERLRARTDNDWPYSDVDVIGRRTSDRPHCLSGYDQTRPPPRGDIGVANVAPLTGA